VLPDINLPKAILERLGWFFWWLPLVTDRLAMDGSEPLSEYFRTVLMVGMAIIYLVQTKHSAWWGHFRQSAPNRVSLGR